MRFDDYLFRQMFVDIQQKVGDIGIGLTGKMPTILGKSLVKNVTLSRSFYKLCGQINTCLKLVLDSYHVCI